MFEDYEDVFDEPSDAEVIIRQTQKDLNGLLKGSVIELINDARDAKKKLEDTNMMIRKA